MLGEHASMDELRTSRPNMLLIQNTFHRGRLHNVCTRSTQDAAKALKLALTGPPTHHAILSCLLYIVEKTNAPPKFSFIPLGARDERTRLPLLVHLGRIVRDDAAVVVLEGVKKEMDRFGKAVWASHDRLGMLNGCSESMRGKMMFPNFRYTATIFYFFFLDRMQ